MLSQFFDLLIIITVSAVIAVVLGHLLFRDRPRKKKISQIAIFILSMGFFNGIILPSYHSPEIATRSSEQLWSRLPLIETIKEHDPELYQQWRSTAKQAKKQGASNDEVVAMLQQKMQIAFQQRLAYTSDEALLGFIDTLLPNLDVLRQQSAEACYQLLYPQAAIKNIKAEDYLSKQALENNMNAMSRVIIDAAEKTPEALPASELLNNDMKQIFSELKQKYGEDIHALEDPLNSKISKARICDMNHAFYQKVMQQDKTKAVNILRLSFSQY